MKKDLEVQEQNKNIITFEDFLKEKEMKKAISLIDCIQKFYSYMLTTQEESGDIEDISLSLDISIHEENFKYELILDVETEEGFLTKTLPITDYTADELHKIGINCIKTILWKSYIEESR